MKTPSTTRKIINIALIIVLILLIINLISEEATVFGITMPVIFVMAWSFLLGWYASKSFGWEFDVDKIKKSINSVEAKMENSMGKASDKVKNTVEDIKEHIEDAKKEVKREVKKITPKKAPAKKATPTRKPAAKK